MRGFPSLLSWAPAAPMLSLVVILVSSSASAIPVTVVGTNDVHGRVERMPAFAGHVKILRDKAKAEGGVVVVVDAGDMFQGTLESNLVEGKSIIAAYNIFMPDAVAIGNHEFDFGPAGPLAMPRTDKDDARGALKARAAEAKFPFLAANLIDEATGKPVVWPNVKPSHLVERGGVKVGIIGVTTEQTAFTTSSANFKGLRTAVLREVIAEQAHLLRKRGADVIVVSAHAGGKCEKLDDPNDTGSCERDQEGFQLAYSLPKGLVDVIVAGHTHSTVAHFVNEIPVIESWANGRGFGRVDLDVDKKTRKVRVVKLHQPHQMCADDAAAVCELGEYEGKRVVADAAIERAIATYVEEARRVKTKKLGVRVSNEVRRGYDEESALGNLFADLMLQASPGADVALMNGGGIRANLPAGELTYGHIFEMMPFDNRYATVTATGADLKRWLAKNFSARKGGILSVAGVVVDVSCEGKTASVTLYRAKGGGAPGAVIGDDERVVISTSDFLATGGEATKLPAGSVKLDDGEPIRESLASTLTKRGGTLDGDALAKLPRRVRPGRCKG